MDKSITQYQCDDFGRRLKVISPDTGTTIYSHDQVGNIAQKTDAKGTVVNCTYDALNRITATQFTDSTQNITYTYDSTSVTNGKGRLTGRTDTSGSYTFWYDAQANLTQEDKTIGNVLYTTQYSYNGDNNVTSITYPTGRVITYTPDVTGRITQVDTTLNGNPKTLTSLVSYYPYGGVGGLTYGNGLSLTHGYDNQYRTSSITVGSILGRTYGYDDNGNVNTITDTYMFSNGQGVEQARGYIYENGTNLLNDVWGGMSVVYDYDENGNTIIENNRTYIYDLSNRLVTVQDGSVTIAQYVYNALNQRIKKILPGGETRIFHYDLQGHLIAETDATGVMLGEYVYLRDELLVMIRPGQVDVAYYYHNDHLGTPQILTDGSGSIAWKAIYKPYGEAVSSIETVQNPFRFPGQYYDQETGLHYNWNRYYDPTTGRYLTPDPIGLEGGINPFSYALNNSMTYLDRSGLAPNCGLTDAELQAILNTFPPNVDLKTLKCMIHAESSGNPYAVNWDPTDCQAAYGCMQIKLGFDDIRKVCEKLVPGFIWYVAKNNVTCAVKLLRDKYGRDPQGTAKGHRGPPGRTGEVEDPMSLWTGGQEEFNLGGALEMDSRRASQA